jgi:hypothetical protein
LFVYWNSQHGEAAQKLGHALNNMHQTKKGKMFHSTVSGLAFKITIAYYSGYFDKDTMERNE